MDPLSIRGAAGCFLGVQQIHIMLEIKIAFVRNMLWNADH